MATIERYVNDMLVGYEIDGMFVPLGANYVESSQNDVKFDTVEPVISEGGRGAIMPDTHHVVVHKASDMGLEPFTLERSKRIGTKYIHENGIYRASDDDMYAWSKVSVNVFGGIGGGAEGGNGGEYIPTVEIDGVQVPVHDGGSEVHYDGYVIQRGVGSEITGLLYGGATTIKCFNGSYINGITNLEENGRLINIGLLERSMHHYILVDCSGSMDDKEKLQAIQNSLVDGHRYAVYAYGDYGQERLVQSFTTDLGLVNAAIRRCTTISLGGSETYQAFLEQRLSDSNLSITEVFTDEDPYQSHGSGLSPEVLIDLYTARGNEFIVHDLR